MAISRAQLLKELLPGLNALFGMEYARYGEQHKEIYETETSERSFEEEIAKLADRRFAVTCSNGTTALYMAIKALGLPKGSEVILPSMTIVSCLTAVLENDLKPVFCDSNPDTWNIDFDSVRDKITDMTTAVMIVDTYGLIVNPEELFEFRKQYPDIKIIEDASEAHGAYYWEHKAGSLGDISTGLLSEIVLTT